MRCSLGPKKLARYSLRFGVFFRKGLVRGNTDHRIYLQSVDGEGFSLWPGDTELTPDPWGNSQQFRIKQFYQKAITRLFDEGFGVKE